MRAKIAGAALAAVLGGWLAGAAPGQAASLSGDTLDASYYYPNLSTKYLDAGTLTDPTARFAIPRDPKGFGTLGPYSIRYIFGQTNTFTPATFDGVVFTDDTAARIRGVAFNKATNAVGLTASDLTFTSDTISLNLSGVTVQPNTVIQIDVASAAVTGHANFASRQLSVVPLPGAAPMFGAALLALAGFGLVLNRWVAPRTGEAVKG